MLLLFALELAGPDTEQTLLTGLLCGWEQKALHSKVPGEERGWLLARRPCQAPSGAFLGRAKSAPFLAPIRQNPGIC